MRKRIFCIIFSLLIIFSVAVVPVSAYTPTGFEVSAEGALLMSLDTGEVIYSKNTDKKLYPASLTKLMTAVVLYENTPDLDNKVLTVSKHALDLLQGTDSSVGGLLEGEQLTARQMLYVLLLSSANDGANVIAEEIGGDIAGFVGMMNDKAKALGMQNTNFANAHGLHNEDHYTTVYDMSLLAKYFLSIPLLKEICEQVTYTLPATNLSNQRRYVTTNFLITPSNAQYYKYAKGVKTGYTDPAGRCLISTASKNGYNYLCILMKSAVYDGSGKKIRYEFRDTKALYEWAFKDFEYKTVLDSEGILGEAKVELAWDTDYVTLAPKKSLTAIIPKVADKSTIQYDIKTYKESFDAPIKKGDVLGTVTVSYAGEELGSVELIATQDVKRNFFLHLKRIFSDILGSLPFKIVLAIAGALILILIISVIILNKKKLKKRRRYY